MTKREAVARGTQQAKGVASPRASTAFIPSGEAMAAFKAAELGVQAAKKLSEWLQDEGPLVVQVLDAFSQGGNYTVHFRAINQTVHGLYILSASLGWPTRLKNIPLGQRPEVEISFGPRGGIVEQPLPMHVPSAKARDFYLVFPLPPVEHIDGGLWNKRVGKLELAFQLLNQESPSKKPIEFALLLRGDVSQETPSK